MGSLVAAPVTSATGEPKSAPSIRNCTVPVGVPGSDGSGATVAVKVSESPYVGLCSLGWIVVVVLAPMTWIVASGPRVRASTWPTLSVAMV